MASTAPIDCSLELASKPVLFQKVCRDILKHLQAFDYSQDDIFAVHLAIEEAFINAVKHGNQMDPQKLVQVEYRIDSEKFEISVIDAGRGFHPENVPDPRYGENLYKTEGRGLLLMRSYMDQIEFNDAGNGVRMVRYRHARPEG